MTERHDVEHDRLARMLARNAGVDWERLCDYPGYTKYYWREQAHAMRAAFADDPALGRLVALTRQHRDLA